MIVFPNAKINIGLNIIGRRPDGYHNLETIFYPVQIKDALEIIVADELSFQSSGLPIPGAPEDNLCLKAYHLLKQQFDLPPVKIHLHKRIPIGAGLGGGSADAAFFVKLLNQKFALGLTSEDQMAYARQLGADCAFFIENQPVFAFEKGDHFEPVNLDLSNFKVVIVMPPVHVSTAEAFRGIKPSALGPSLKDLIAMPVNEWKNYIRNDFEESVFSSYPVIKEIKASMYRAGAVYASMSGSGASVFGLFDESPDLSHIAKTSEIFSA